MRFINDTPRPVLISIAVLLAGLVLFAILVPVLGGARDDAFAANSQLANEIERIKKSVTQSKTDQEYVANNSAAYEELLKGDRLVPHTRRAATVELENAARANGFTTLNYSIGAVSANSRKAVENQPTSDAYRVSVETITLNVGAPIDGAIYQFMAAINETFPGSAVIDTFSIKRAEVVDAKALSAVSRGGKDAQLVDGEISISWRTAQAKEKPDAEKTK